MTTSDLSDVRVANGTEAIFAEVLADVVGAAQVLPDDDFFDDLGADSMLMARFCARLRKRGDVPSVSIKDVYRHPTVRSLAAALTDDAPASATPPPPSIEAATPVSPRQYALCGALQLLAFLGYTALVALLVDRGYGWISAGSGAGDLYLRSVLFGAVTFLGTATLPILVKWILIGRWVPERISMWSLAYVRFWIVKALVRANPLVLFAGSPLYVLYLRALGAHIGRGVTILSRSMPVCTDLLTIGDGSVVRKDCVFQCYRAEAGVIRTGPVAIGRDAVVSEATVLDIDTSLGDGAQLGHASALYPGQAVPDGQRWHGSPARPTDVDYATVPPAGCSTVRKIAYATCQVLSLLMLHVPLAVGALAFLYARFPELAAVLESDSAWSKLVFYEEVLGASFVLYFGSLLVALLVVTTVPRLLRRAVRVGKVYPLYGFHFGLHRAVGRLTNSPFFLMLFGDSSYIVLYLRALGYHLTPVVQTGSNFGTAVKHETPFLVSIGSGTMVADGLSAMNAEYSSTSFRLAPVTIGSNSFLGNTIAYPPQARMGDNCLLATKVMVPVDGHIRENVGLLGSPCFEIPRSVQRDGRFDHLATGEEFRRRLAAKDRYNRRTMAVMLSVRWVQFFFVLLIGLTGAHFHDRFGALAVVAASLAIIVFNLASSLLIEWAATRFASLQPRFCSIYESYFWFHERYWKLLSSPRVTALLNGTPFKGLWWRLAGVDIGRRVFDDGCEMLERTLVAVGDDCVLNAGSEIQCHSQEDGTFKTDRSTLGVGCTLGVGALVHYGVTMGDGAVLEADSFLMKGEEVPPAARWGGNPARELR